MFYESELDAPKDLRNVNLKTGPPIIGRGEPVEIHSNQDDNQSKLNRALGLGKRVMAVSSYIGIKSLEAPIGLRGPHLGAINKAWLFCPVLFCLVSFSSSAKDQPEGRAMGKSEAVSWGTPRGRGCPKSIRI